MSRPYWINWPAHQLHSWATALMTGLAFSKAFWREIRTLTRLHQLDAIFTIFGASDRDKPLVLKGCGLRKCL
jgi:hypothetical protein